jgi:CheY-like chemotaxis protein
MVQHAGQPGRFKVLLANEQEGWHQTVRRLLEPQGVQTISARSGREALELIESTPVHAAVLDVQMPQLGGMQVIRMMREMHRGQVGPGAGAKEARPVEVPAAILLANDLNSHLLREALSMHVFSVLSKPVDFNVLLDALARVLRRYHESRWPKGQ